MPRKVSEMYRWYLAALWFCMICFIVVTAFTIISSKYPANCLSLLVAGDDQSQCEYSIREDISNWFLENRSYAQSIHSYLIQGILIFAPLVFVPRLHALTWATVEKGTTVKNLQSSVLLSQSPALATAFQYVLSAPRIPWPVAFILLLGLLNLAANFISGAVFTAHDGPFAINSLYCLGGGFNYNMSDTFAASTNGISSGVVKGRAVLTTATAGNATYVPPSGSNQVIPFLTDQDINRIWSADLTGVVAYTSMDCNVANPTSLINIPTSIFELAPGSTPLDNPLTNVTAADGSALGLINADAALWTTYLNSTLDDPQSWYANAQSTLIYIGTNLTIEGGTSIKPPAGIYTPRLANIDVLACTSKVRMEVSTCHIESGRNITCLPAPKAGVLSDFLLQPSILEYVAVAPVWITDTVGIRLPAMDLSKFVGYDLVPVAYISRGQELAWPSVNTTVDQDYLTDTIMPATQHAIIQGALSTFRRWGKADMQARAYYATSKLWLQILLLALLFVVAVVSTVAALLPSARRAEDPSLTRLIAMSQTPGLSPSLEKFADREEPWDEKVEKTRVRYGYDASGGSKRRSLMFLSDDDHSPTPSSRAGEHYPLMGVSSGPVTPLTPSHGRTSSYGRPPYSPNQGLPLAYQD